jgi:hypothetical protein
VAAPARTLGLFLVVLALYGATASGSVGPRLSDGRSMFAVTAALVDRASLDVRPAALGVPGRGGPAGPGIAYSKYGLGQSLVTIPLYLAGRAVAAGLSPASRLQALMMASALLNPILVALLCALLPVLALRMGLATPAVAPWLGLLAGLTTPLWPYAQTYFSEPLIALCLLLALLALWPGSVPHRGALPGDAVPIMRPLSLLACGMALGLAVLARLDSLVYVPLIALAAALLAGRTRSSAGALADRRSASAALSPGGAPPEAAALRVRLARLWRARAGGLDVRRGLAAASLVLLPVLGALACIAWYNVARFGSPLQSGYGRGALGEAVDVVFQRSLGYLLEGLWDLLASPGKGLVFYAPLVLLVPGGAWSLWTARRRGPVALLLALCAASWVAHANLLIRWLGGWAWGPRFLVPVVPLLVLLAGGVLFPDSRHPAFPARRGQRLPRRAVAALALAGLLVQLPAVVADYHPYLDQLSARYSRFPGDPAAPYRAEDAYVPSLSLSPLVGQWRVVLDPATWRDQPAWGHRTAAAVSGSNPGGPHYAAPVPHTWWALLASEGVPWSTWIWPLALLALLGLGGVLLLLAR